MADQLEPLTPAQGRANFLRLLDALGGPTRNDLAWLRAHPVDDP